MTHTKEPWFLGTVADLILVQSKHHSGIANMGYHKLEQNEIDGNRIVACVNACAGMENPEQEIATLRSLTRWHYAPEVPINGSDVLFVADGRKLGGRYIDAVMGFSTPGVSHANVTKWAYWPQEDA